MANTSDPAELSGLEARLGYTFNDRAVLERALAHRSWCSEHAGEESNERLEFLGDAVLGWVIADLAYQRFADVGEGTLTDLRKSVVNALALAAIAEELDIGRHILLGRGEETAGGAKKPSILSDTFEAILGAIYVDGGSRPAHDFVERHVAPHLGETTQGGVGHLEDFDPKTRLQELCAAQGREPPEYEQTSTGPDHAKVFTARVQIGGEVLGEGTGRSKKAAEQAAAAVACERLGGDA